MMLQDQIQRFDQVVVVEYVTEGKRIRSARLLPHDKNEKTAFLAELDAQPDVAAQAKLLRAKKLAQDDFHDSKGKLHPSYSQVSIDGMYYGTFIRKGREWANIKWKRNENDVPIIDFNLIDFLPEQENKRKTMETARRHALSEMFCQNRLTCMKVDAIPTEMRLYLAPAAKASDYKIAKTKPVLVNS